MTELPKDIRPEWLAVVRRLQFSARKGEVTIVSISVIVDQNGLPKFWLEPKCRTIEPRRSAEEILATLAAAARDGIVS